MRTALLLAAVLLAFAPALVRAQGPAAPLYQRVRSGADNWHARGGGQNWRGGGYDNGGYGGFYNPYFAAPPLIVRSYYQRPYPYHFDYYRNRWGAQEASYEVRPGIAAPHCPCAFPPPVEVVQ
jgi:hypothetical protein